MVEGKCYATHSVNKSTASSVKRGRERKLEREEERN
jgi:hypothetical protein